MNSRQSGTTCQLLLPFKRPPLRPYVFTQISYITSTNCPSFSGQTEGKLLPDRFGIPTQPFLDNLLQLNSYVEDCYPLGLLLVTSCAIRLSSPGSGQNQGCRLETPPRRTLSTRDIPLGAVTHAARRSRASGQASGAASTNAQPHPKRVPSRQVISPTPKLPGTGFEPAWGINPTRPSTWRVCQFRHPGESTAHKVGLRRKLVKS